MIGLRALINENCIVEDALIMGADYYETLEECALVPGCLPMGLGEHPLCDTDTLLLSNFASALRSRSSPRHTLIWGVSTYPHEIESYMGHCVEML